MADLIANLQAAAGAAGGGGWDISTAVYDPGSDAWNVSKATYTQLSFSLGSQDGTMRGIFFKQDGTKMYTVGSDNDKVYEYNLSTAWNVSTASFVQNFSVTSQDPTPSDLFFKPDGTKMYVLGDDNNKVYEYNLSTAWNISTASFSQDFSVGTQEANATGLFFKPDGTKMYVCGFSGDDVNEYNLSTAWDVTTASYVQVFSVSAQETVPEGVSFKPDGTKMYVIGSTGDDINEYTLSTPWDISTASYVQVFSISGQTTQPFGVFFKDDGSAFYVVAGQVFQYVIGGFSVATQETTPSGVFFKPDGTKMYVSGTASDSVNEYSLSSAWDITTASYVRAAYLPSLGGNIQNCRGVFFSDDGTRMYVIDPGSAYVAQYSLSTAWNVSTLSYVRFLSVATQEADPSAVSFKNDGTKMYVIGRAGDDVNEYSLSTAWNISTTSYVQNFSISAKETTPWALFFKPDGTKMYITGESSDQVHQYGLSTAWNVSTATFEASFSVKNQENTPTGISFNDEGTQLFVVGYTTDKVFSYTLE